MNSSRLLTLPRLSHNLRVLLLLSLSVLALAAALALYLNATVFAPAPLPVTARRTIPQTDVNPFGANFFLEREVEAWKRERTVAMAVAAGIGWARQEFVWEEIEPERGQFNWNKYDDLVALFTRNHIQIIARLDRPPPWARQNASGTGASGPPDDYETYGAFVEAFARHYRGQIYYLQIWNEPNLAREWNDAPIDPAAYVRLLRIAYTRAKGANPDVRILTAPLAITLGEPYPRGENVFRNMNDLQFLDEMYAANATDYFDILSANAFGLGSPPEDPPDPGKLNFQRVMLERAVMEKHGDANKSVWINEYGWNAAPDSIPDSRLIWGRVSEDQQADYTVRGIEYARKNWAWVGVLSIWFFRQVGDISPNNPEYFFRMVDTDFTPRPVYVRVSDAARAMRQVGPGEYEDTNPALDYKGDWTPRFDPHASAGQDVTTTQDGAQVTLKFVGDALDLKVEKRTTAGRMSVTVDGQNVEGLPRDPGGKSYIELGDGNGGDQWQAIMHVARGLRQGEHTAQLTGTGDINLDGFIVPAIQVPAPPWVPIGTMVVMGLLGAGLLVRELQAKG